MSCLRYDLWQRMTAYAHGELPAELVSRMEDHLADCEACRLRLEKIQRLDRIVTHLPAEHAAESSWSAIEASILRVHKVPARPREPRYFLRFAGGMAALLALLLTVILWNDGFLSFIDRGAEEFSSGQYREVSLRDIPNTAEPHVFTEGYVSEVRMDQEEGDTMFRLVDDLRRPNHFVICEIIPPMDMKVPEIGSKIRVYGVSRYDNKAEHQWFELHPVMNIEPVH